jgi:O-antigen ligase
MNLNNIFQKIDLKTGIYYSLIIMTFGLPWSGILFRLGFFSFLFLFVVSGQWVEKIKTILDFKIIWASSTLFFTALISLTYTIAPLDLAWLDVERYLKLLLIGPLIFVIDSKKKRLGILTALTGGVAALMLPTLLDGAGIAKALNLPIQQFANQAYTINNGDGVMNLVYWRNQIVHGFFVSILFFLCLCATSELKKNRFALVTLTLLCIIDVTLYIAGRMALLSLFASFLFFAFFKIRSFAGRLLGLTCLVVVFLTAYLFVDKISLRINTIFSETKSYYLENNNLTSAGHRLHYWKISLDLFDQSKITGAGAGAFRHTLIATNDPLATGNHSHAHNEYLTILSQYGLIGFFIFIGMLTFSFFTAGKLEDYFERYSYQGIILIFSMSTSTDSMLYNPHEGWTLVIVMALIATASKSQYLERINFRHPM